MVELGEQFLTAVTKKTTVSKPKTAKKPAAPPPPRDPRVEEAELWAKQRILARATPMVVASTEVDDEDGVSITRIGMPDSTEGDAEDGGASSTTEKTTPPRPFSTGGIIPTTMPPLRAYYLWYKNEDLDADDVAGLLRDPPLATNTVVGYIVKAIKAEKLPYDKGRLLEGVLGKLSALERQSFRYRGLMIACRDRIPRRASEHE